MNDFTTQTFRADLCARSPFGRVCVFFFHFWDERLRTPLLVKDLQNQVGSNFGILRGNSAWPEDLRRYIGSLCLLESLEHGDCEPSSPGASQRLDRRSGKFNGKRPTDARVTVYPIVCSCCVTKRPSTRMCKGGATHFPTFAEAWCHAGTGWRPFSCRDIISKTDQGTSAWLFVCLETEEAWRLSAIFLFDAERVNIYEVNECQSINDRSILDAVHAAFIFPPRTVASCNICLQRSLTSCVPELLNTKKDESQGADYGA
jgi:hypothetical protein